MVVRILDRELVELLPGAVSQRQRQMLRNAHERAVDEAVRAVAHQIQCREDGAQDQQISPIVIAGRDKLLHGVRDTADDLGSGSQTQLDHQQRRDHDPKMDAVFSHIGKETGYHALAVWLCLLLHALTPFRPDSTGSDRSPDRPDRSLTAPRVCPVPRYDPFRAR